MSKKTAAAIATFLVAVIGAVWTLVERPADTQVARTDVIVASAPEVSLPQSRVGEEAWLVTRVVDGDTFRAVRGSTTETVRLIGVDTPETVKPRTAVQCFGTEASAEAKRLLASSTVYLAQDPTQDTRDRYGRLLAYAWLPDGTFVNRALIESGFAHEYTYRDAYAHQAAFKAAEQAARAEGRGLWAPGACPEA